MPSIKISQLNIANSLSDTDYLVVDNLNSTKKTSVNTLVEKVSTSMTVGAIEAAIVSLSSSVIYDRINTIIAQVSGLSATYWNTAYDLINSRNSEWNRAYDFISNTEEATMTEKYLVTSPSIQIKGEIEPGNILVIYTAITVESVAGLAIGASVRDSNNKIGTIKHIDTANKIIYVREESSSSDFNIDITLDILTAGSTAASTSARAFGCERFNTILRENHTLKIFNACTTGINAIDNITSLAITKSGDIETTNYHYKIAQFEYATGRVSLPFPISDTASVLIQNTSIEKLDNSNSNILNISKSSLHGALIYRAVGSSSTPAPEAYKLVYVLGDSEIGRAGDNSIFEDKGLFSINRWASDIKNVIDGNGTGPSTGEYKSIYHFPLTIKELKDNAAKYAKGFVTRRVSSFISSDKQRLQLDLLPNKLPSSELTSDGGIVDIFIDNSVAYNNAGNIVGGFTAAVRDVLNKTLTRIYLQPGVYYTSPFNIDDNTFITGASERNTIIRTLPWNFDDTGNPNNTACLINGSGKKNIDISNITIDGNYNNNISWESFTKNFIINNNLVDDITYRNVNVINTAGGGIYAKKSNNLKLVTSSIRNGGLGITVDEQSTAFYAPQSNSFTIHNCNMENWLGSIDLSLTLVGSVTNNVIKNCGSGVLAYGSSSLLLSPNLVLGQNNELLPVADLYDTNFDAVNLDIDSPNYISDIILYMRDGVPADLSTSEGVVLSSSIETLVELNGYVYTLKHPAFNYSTYGVLSTPSISIISSPAQLSGGYVQFKIVQDALSAIPTYSKLHSSYYSLTTRLTGEKLVGLNYKLKATEYLYTGSTDTKIRPTYYQFLSVGTGSILELTLNNTFPNVTHPSVLAVGDIIKPFFVSRQDTDSFDGLDFKITRINDIGDYKLSAINTTYTNNISTLQTLNTNLTQIYPNIPYIGVKNEYIISRGRINKTS